MNVLILGSGGREHSLAWKLSQNPGIRLHATPGNPGIGSIAALHNAVDSVALAKSLDIDLTVVGPEQPLVEGVADRFAAAGLRILGPSAAAAQLEGSKMFAKELMDAAGIPTARFQSFDQLAAACRALMRFEYPVVIKADGLAAGKGVVIARDRQEAETTLDRMFSGELAGAAGSQVVIEDFCPGEELSFIALSDGENVVPLPPAQDHKQVLEGDRGPNTGGMGAYCDDRILTPQLENELLRTVIQPAIDEMARRGTPFRGFLFAGIMLTATGPKVLEFNVRLGDPETQTILHRLDSNLAELLDAAASARLREVTPRWQPSPAACVVLCAEGYPGAPRKGDEIAGIPSAEANGVVVFHAGTQLQDGRLVTNGGRVLGVTASAPTLPAALARAYEGVSRIRFAGMHYRRDIGSKGLKRWAAGSGRDGQI